MLRCKSTDVPHGWGKDGAYPVIIEVDLPSFVVRDKDELHWPFGWSELHRRLVRLFFGGHEAHVPGWDADKGGHIGVASDSSRGPR